MKFHGTVLSKNAEIKLEFIHPMLEIVHLYNTHIRFVDVYLISDSFIDIYCLPHSKSKNMNENHLEQRTCFDLHAVLLFQQCIRSNEIVMR